MAAATTSSRNRALTRSWGFAAAIGALCGIHAATAAAGSVPDYGRAFGLFAAFGLESVEPGGQYVALALDAPRVQQQPIISAGQLPTTGKAWVWPGSNGAPARYLYLGGLGGTCLPGDEANPAAYPGAAQFPRATWTANEADLAADVAGILRLLRSPSPYGDAEAPEELDEEEEDDSNDYFRRQVAQPETAGALLLAAAHVHQAGLTNEANEIADRLFGMAEDRGAVVREAVTHLARAQYLAAGARLAASRDWPAYRRDLQAVLDRFGTAWDKTPGLEILIAKVDRQIAGAPPAGEGLDEDAARFFAGISPADAGLFNQLRLAAIVNPAVQLGLLAAPGDEPARRFFARGIHMIPALLAVADSDYLLPEEVRVASSYRSRSYTYSSRSDQGLKSAEEIFVELDGKPPVLGDVATDLLGAIVPSRGADPVRNEELRSNVVAATRAFYAGHAADTPLALATHYLSAGNIDQADTVAGVLLRSKNSNVLALAEAHVFSSNFWSVSSYSVLNHSATVFIRNFIAERPERAAALLPDFIDRIKSELPERLAAVNESRRELVRREVEGVLDDLAQMLQAVPGGEPAATNTVPADSELARRRAGLALMEKVKGLPPRESVGTFLDGIVAQDDPETRISLLLSLWSFQYEWLPRESSERRLQDQYRLAQNLAESFDDELFRDPDYAAKVAARAGELRAAAPAAEPADKAARAATGKEVVLDFAKQWEILLADDRRTPQNENPLAFMSGFGLPPDATVADAAAYVLSSILLETTRLPNERQMELHGLGSRLNSYWRKVARAALDGASATNLPPLPKAEDVPPETVSNLVARLVAAAPEEAGKLVRKLEPDALLALGRAAAADKALRAALAPSANRVVRVGEDCLAEYAPRLEPLVGATLSTNLIDALLDVATSLATQSVSAIVGFRRGSWLDGAAVFVSTNLGVNYNPYGGNSDPDRARIVVMCQSPSDHDYAVWEVPLPAAPTGGAATNAAADPETDALKILKQFNVSLDGGPVPPEVLAQMAAAMARHNPASDPAALAQAQAELLKTVGRYASGAESPLANLLLAFTISLPPKEGEDKSGNPMEFYEEELFE